MVVMDFAISKEDWRVKTWGDGMKSIIGYGSVEAVSRNVMDFFTEDVHDILTEKLQRAGEGESPQYFRIPFYTKAGEELDLFMYAHSEHPAADGDAEIIVRTGVIPSSYEMPFTTDPMTIGIDFEGIVTLWDEKAEAVTGMGYKFVRGQKFLPYFMTEEFGARDFMAEKIKLAMAGEHVGSFMVPIFTLAAELKIVELSVSRTSGGGVMLTNGLAAPRGISKESMGDMMSRKLAEERTGDTLPTACPSSELPHIRAFESADLPALSSDK